MSYGPPTASGRTLLILTLALLPLVFIFHAFVTAEKGLETFSIFRNSSRSDNSVRTKVVTTLEDSHETVQEIQKQLWWMDDQGSSLFGDAHSWQISDFKTGETYEQMKGRLVHPEFAILWNAKSKPEVYEMAREVMLEYGRQRTFYSEMSLLVGFYNQQAKDQLRSLPQSATYDKSLTAKDLALQIARAKQESQTRRDAFEKLIVPFFHNP